MQQAKPRIQAAAPAPAPKPARVRSDVRPNRRIGAPTPSKTAAPLRSVRAPTRVASFAPGRALTLLRGLARPQLGPRARRLLGAGMRLGVAFTLAWGLLLGFQQGYQYVTTSAHFEARSVVFEPTPHLSADRLTELMGLAPGTNILAVDVDAVRRKIEADPWVASATVSRQLPDTLHVAVAEHTPTAVLLSGHFYLLDQTGAPFKRVEPGERGELPIVTGVDRELLVKGDPAANQIIRRALDVLAAYDAKARPRLAEIHVGDGGEALLYTEKTGTLLRLGRGPVDERLARYDALRAALGERADKLSVVHLDANHSADQPARVIASFVDDSAATLAADSHLLAQADPKPVDKVGQAAAELAAMAQKPAAAHAPGKPAKKQGKPVKAKGGAHKFPSGIPKYD